MRIPKKVVKKKVAKKSAKPTLGERIVGVLLSKGPLNSDGLARALRSPAASVSSACSRLFKAGRLVRADGGGRGREAVWKALKRAKKVA